MADIPEGDLQRRAFVFCAIREGRKQIKMLRHFLQAFITWRQLMMNVCVTTSVYNHSCRGLPRNMGRINLVWSTNSNEQLKKKRLGSQVQNFSLYSRHYQSISINRLLLIIDDQSMKKIFVTLSVVIDCHRLLLIITTQFFTLQIWKFDTFILKTWLFNSNRTSRKQLT